MLVKLARFMKLITQKYTSSELKFSGHILEGTYIILVICSVFLMAFYFVGVQYKLSRTAQSGDETLRKAIAGDFKDEYRRYESSRRRLVFVTVKEW